MSKIALMTLLNRANSALSMHFGKAKWILVHDTEEGTSYFVQNEGLNGKSVVNYLLREGCSDVICTEIGEGAVENLKRANIRGWLAPADTTAPRALEMFTEGSLQPVHATKDHGEGVQQQRGEHSDGCGCNHRHGEGHSGVGCGHGARHGAGHCCS
ncbi:MAG: NifB/NifX family molybdenum-iron cluster-binding protein [Acidobacteriaceae bacterium]